MYLYIYIYTNSECPHWPVCLCIYVYTEVYNMVRLFLTSLFYLLLVTVVKTETAYDKTLYVYLYIYIHGITNRPLLKLWMFRTAQDDVKVVEPGHARMRQCIYIYIYIYTYTYIYIWRSDSYVYIYIHIYIYI